jgi:hypothetical protein
MNMKLMVFLAHDPGSYDVTNPVYNKLMDKNHDAKYFCVGPAASLNPEHAVSEPDFLTELHAYLRTGTISVLVTGRSWGTDLEPRAIRLCQAFHIPTVAILDYWSNYTMRLAPPSNAVICPDHYVVMDELAKKEAMLEGVSESIIRVLGHPGLDRYVGYRSKQSKPISKALKVLYLSQPLSQLYGDSWGYTEQSVWQDLLRANEQIPMQLHVKFHPKDNPSFKEQFGAMSVTGDLIELMPQYDLVIGMNSMALLHAVIMGVRAVSYQPQLKKPDVCITTKLGLTPLLDHYSQLIAYLQQLQLSMENSEPLAAIHNEAYLWFDGQSAERVALFVEDVIRNGKN